MRLIETKTLKLIEFWTESAPKYAILSHRWDEGEISLAEYTQPTASTKQKDGWSKISACAQQALSDGFAYIWVDTCCIDKSSSAELTEAINSMYRWYQQSEMCYVYMNDVPYERAFVADSATRLPVAFERSQWHTRGWTLQELLAPTKIHFYSKEWKRLDADAKIDIHEHISHATGIEIDVLKGKIPVHSTPIAKRMSWASARQTTRTEDMAYCLLGIFDVNMPMLYGEGPKAFTRLQEEIMKTSRDQTLFVWAHVQDDPTSTGLLARHPRNFKNSANFEDKSQLQGLNIVDYQAGREGITLSLFLGQNQEMHENSKGQSNSPEPKSETRPQIYNAVITCAERDSADRFAAIQLVKHGSDYMRHRQVKLQVSRLTGLQQEVFIRHQTPPQPANDLKQEYVRIVFETNCPNAYIFAMPTKKATPLPLFRSKKARLNAEPALAHNAELAAQVSDIFGGRRLTSLDDGEIPMRHLTTKKRETFNPMEYELGYDVSIGDLKWAYPLLPNSLIAYMRIVPGVRERGCRGVSVGADVNARLGFNSGHGTQNSPILGDNMYTTPIAYGGEYSLFFHRKYFDRPSAGNEIAEVKLSLRHHKWSDTELQDTDTWEFKAGTDDCPCNAMVGAKVRKTASKTQA